MYLYEYIFDLPLTWSADYTEKHIRQEGNDKSMLTNIYWLYLSSHYHLCLLIFFVVDFENEGRNAEKTKKHLEMEKSLRDKAYVPKVYWDHTSKRVLTAEWIDGVKITDQEGIQRLN